MLLSYKIINQRVI